MYARRQNSYDMDNRVPVIEKLFQYYIFTRFMPLSVDIKWVSLEHYLYYIKQLHESKLYAATFSNVRDTYSKKFCAL
jgi:hypothetical protein